MLPYFIFNGIDSRTKNIMVNEYPPRILPKSRTTEITVPGRDGTLTIDEGAYDNLILTCDCTALPIANIEEISAWLRGAGDLVFGHYENRSIRARVDAQISFDKLMRGRAHRGFTIPFVCQPGRYTYPPVADIVRTTTGTVTNPGTMPSQPKIKVVATGEITLTVGNSIMLIDGPETEWTLVIDSELMDCFDSTMTILRNDWMTGDFPLLSPGANAVTWDGTVASVTITPRWRYL